MESWVVIAALAIVLLTGLLIGAVVAAVVARRANRLAVQAAVASAGADAQARLATAEARLGERADDVADLQARLDAALLDARAAFAALADVREDRAVLEAELREERERAGDKVALLGQARDELAAHFKALAGDALEANRSRIADQHHGALDLILKPLGEKLMAFEKKVEETYDKEAQQRFSLQQEVLNLQLATGRITEDANNLTRALKGEAKTRGNWGEVVLERVLERSGLVKGIEYEVQRSLKGDEGNTLRPDVVVRLPDNKHIVIDSKVSLVAYDRYYAASDDDGRTAAGRQHVDAIRKHARDLGAKGYHGLSDLDTPDFVAMFVPIEPALGLAASLDEALFVDAWGHRVVMVTPSTLLAVLTTVQSLWRREKQTKNAIDIAEKAGALYDQFVRVVDSLDAVGLHLDRASRAFEATRSRLSVGNGNVVRRVEALREMGAKAKRRLPAAWTAREGRDEEPDEADGPEVSEQTEGLDGPDEPDPLDELDKHGDQDRLDGGPDGFDEPGKLDEHDHLDKLEKPGKLDEYDHLDKLDKPGKLDKLDKLDKPGKLDRHDKPGNPTPASVVASGSGSTLVSKLALVPPMAGPVRSSAD